MSISQTIIERWNDLSDSAQEHIRQTRSDLLSTWDLIEDGYCFASVEADDLDEALERAEEEVDPGVYDTSNGTVYADIYVRNRVTGERGLFTLTVEPEEPEEPECADGEEHEWRSPYSVLGGCRENPGVWGHGGGVIIWECCARCGAYRITDTWAQRPDTGEQGLTAVTYEDADDASRAWLYRRLICAAESVDLPDGYTLTTDEDEQSARLIRDEDDAEVSITDDELRAVVEDESWDAIIDQFPEDG